MKRALSSTRSLIERINRTAHVPEGKAFQAARTRTRSLHRVLDGGNRVVNPPVRHSRFDRDHRQLFRLDSLTAPFPQAEGGRLVAPGAHRHPPRTPARTLA